MNVKMTLLRSGGAIAIGLGALVGQGAHASEINYSQLAKEQILKCIHPTTSVDNATVEIEKGPVSDGDITTTRLKIFYAGLLKHNEMEISVMTREAGSIRQLKVQVLADSAMELGHCSLVKQWSDF